MDDPKCFFCPYKPGRGKEVQRTGRVSAASTGYVYVTGLKDTDPSMCVVAYCRPGNHERAWGYILFLDTHAEGWDFESGKLEEYLAETRAYLEDQGREFKLLYETAPPEPRPRRWPYWFGGALAAAAALLLWHHRRERRQRAAS